MAAPIYPALVTLARPGPNGGTPVGDATTPLVTSSAVGGAAVSATNPMPVTQPTFKASATFARPANVTPYTAKDAVSNSAGATTLMQFAALALAVGGAGIITKARVVTDKEDFLPRLRLWLYTVTEAGVTVAADNAAFGILYADRAKRIGYIDFNALAPEDTGAGDCASSLRDDLRLQYACDAADTKLYGVLETLDGATPASAQNFYVELEGLLLK